MSAYSNVSSAESSADLNAMHELSIDELQQVSGGMNLDNVRESSNVVDARGGTSTFLFWRISYDANGHVSDVSWR